MRGRFRVDPRPAPGRASIGIPKRRKTMRTLVIAAIVVAASTGTALAQDAAAGEQVFDKYIRAPMQEMPGTRMAFVGIKNDKDIGDIWAYLKQFGPDGTKK